MREIIAKAVRWHLGTLPPAQQLSFLDMHVSGPALHGGVCKPTRFHTYACLYPERGQYVAANTGDWPGCAISAIELRKLIADLTINQDKIQEQQTIATQYVDPSTTTESRWEIALEASHALQLPIGMFMVGDTLTDNKRVVYMRVMALAPLDMVLAEFKRAAPLIGFN